MNIARAFGLVAVWSVALAQEAAPLRFTAALDTVTNYGGKYEPIPVQMFMTAFGPDGSSRIPEGLQAAVWRQSAYRSIRYVPTFYNSTETVHDILEDGSRVVLVEEVNLSDSDRTTAEMTRMYQLDGSIKLEDLFVNHNDNDASSWSYPSDEEISSWIAESLKSQPMLEEYCYKTMPGLSKPLFGDPETRELAENQTEPQTSNSKIRHIGDLRLLRLPNGKTECRISFDPQAYTPRKDAFRYVSREIRQYESDGRLEHSESISSARHADLKNAKFKFEGKEYRVNSFVVSKSVGSTDRLR
jgi:hypothetical protein